MDRLHAFFDIIHQDPVLSQVKALMLRLDGKGIDERDERGRQIFDDTLLIIINGSERKLRFVLPETEYQAPWSLMLDTRDARPHPGQTINSESVYELVARSIAIFRTPSRQKDEQKEEKDEL